MKNPMRTREFETKEKKKTSASVKPIFASTFLVLLFQNESMLFYSLIVSVQKSIFFLTLKPNVAVPFSSPYSDLKKLNWLKLVPVTGFSEP